MIASPVALAPDLLLTVLADGVTDAMEAAAPPAPSPLAPLPPLEAPEPAASLLLAGVDADAVEDVLPVWRGRRRGWGTG